MSYMRDADDVRLDTISVKARLDALEAKASVTLLAYSDDRANTAIALGAGVFTPLPQTFSVPPTTTDVILTWGGQITITAAGAGTVAIGPADISSGAAPTALLALGGVSGTFTTGTFSAQVPHANEINIGPSATWRAIRLYGFVGRDASSVLAASMRASGASPYGTRTWMKAVLA